MSEIWISLFLKQPTWLLWTSLLYHGIAADPSVAHHGAASLLSSHEAIKITDLLCRSDASHKCTYVAACMHCMQYQIVHLKFGFALKTCHSRFAAVPVLDSADLLGPDLPCNLSFSSRLSSLPGFSAMPQEVDIMILR